MCNKANENLSNIIVIIFLSYMSISVRKTAKLKLCGNLEIHITCINNTIITANPSAKLTNKYEGKDNHLS